MVCCADAVGRSIGEDVGGVSEAAMVDDAVALRLGGNGRSGDVPFVLVTSSPSNRHPVSIK